MASSGYRVGEVAGRASCRTDCWSVIHTLVLSFSMWTMNPSNGLLCFWKLLRLWLDDTHFSSRNNITVFKTYLVHIAYGILIIR